MWETPKPNCQPMDEQEARTLTWPDDDICVLNVVVALDPVGQAEIAATTKVLVDVNLGWVELVLLEARHGHLAVSKGIWRMARATNILPGPRSSVPNHGSWLGEQWWHVFAH